MAKRTMYQVIRNYKEVENYFLKGMANVFVGIIIHLFGDDVLVIRESDKKLFRFPGGSIRDTEDILDAAAREVLEEVGFKINLDELKFLIAYVVKDEKRTVDAHIIVFFEFNMIDGWVNASAEEISQAIKFSGSKEVTTEIRFVNPKFDDFGMVVFDENDSTAWLSPFHLRALRCFINEIIPEFSTVV